MTTTKPESKSDVSLPLTTANPSPEEVAAALQALREPFAAHQISKLPKPIVKTPPGEKPTYYDCKPGTNASADGVYCGGRHARSIHLDYVGHAALTDRLLSVDLLWDWEPLSFDENGLPQFDRNGGMWIRLTVAGVSRLGYGDSQGKTGPNAIKEAVGDALRNSAMRYGAALDLWHKGDLHDAAAEQGRDGLEAGADDTPGRDWVTEASASKTTEEFLTLWREAKKLGVDETTVAKMVEWGEKIRAAEAAEVERAAKAGSARADAEEAASEALAKGFGGADPSPRRGGEKDPS
jgi:hypothetical protein